MAFLTMEEIRINVAARIIADDDTIISDIEDGTVEHDNLIRALDVLTAPEDKGAGDGGPGLGRKIEITSLRRDHHRDDTPAYGEFPGGPENHGHTNGWAVDIGAVDGIQVGPDNPKTRGIVIELITKNKYVTKVGVGGDGGTVSNDPELQALAAQHHTLLFHDNDQPHIHFQSA